MRFASQFKRLGSDMVTKVSVPLRPRKLGAIRKMARGALPIFAN